MGRFDPAYSRNGVVRQHLAAQLAQCLTAV